jgi:tetratricopeptide (TPR) repeat protein
VADKELQNVSTRCGPERDAAIERGDWDSVIADCSEAIGRDPTDADAHLYRGWAYRKKGDWEKAIADFSEVIRLDPTDAHKHSYFSMSGAHDRGVEESFN